MHGVLKPHLSLDVGDIKASVAFYSKLFDTAPLKHRPGAADPDGNRWEFLVVVEDADRMQSEDSSCCTEAAPASCDTKAARVIVQGSSGAWGCSA